MSITRILPAITIALTMGAPIAGCRQTGEPVDVLLWEGELEPVAGSSNAVSGSIAMVANEHDTQIGIGINASAGARLGWVVRSGTCANPGDRLGPNSAFPEISVSDAGDGEAETVIRRRVANAAQYAGAVYATVNATDQPIACADMVRID